MFSIIARWRLFKKMGYDGWVSLIPFYSDFCMFEALYGNGWRILHPIIVMIIVYCISFLLFILSKEFSFIVFGIISYIIYIIYFVMSFVMRLTHSFGKDGFWTFGTLMFYPVFRIVYGISDLRFNDRPYPYPEKYDTFDGFVDFFRSQRKVEQVVEDDDAHKLFCSNCGAPISLNTKFCIECGTPVED